ncbi:MAG: DUF2785 domain-containing protein [Alphaproteobacteria bacterium]
MRAPIFLAFSLLSLSLGGCANEVLPVISSCQPVGYDNAALLELREKDFAISDNEARQKLALELADCLSDSNPDIRDGVGYEGLATWMRAKALNAETLRSLKQTLLENIAEENDLRGFGKPFAALVLSEIARVDRVSPFMSNYDRTAFVKAAEDYMVSIEDYRGYDDKSGWRHNVAHGADWLMQLSLNNQITRDDFVRIRDAVASQIRADNEHAYIHGESDRLARPILFLARRGAFTEAEWTHWLAEMAKPDPLETWNAAFKSEAGLAQRHNVKLFFNALYLNASLSQDDGTRQLLTGTKAALKQLP